MIPIAAADKPPTEWDGLQQTKSKRVQLLYVRPGATLQGYKLVRLEPLQVEFDKNWDPNSSRHGAARLTADDFAKMKKNLATIFHEQCGKDLAKGGYKLSTQAGDDVLDVTPIVVDLYVAAPDKMTPGRSYTYVADPGRMTLVAELRDSDTNQVIARAIDKRAATGWGGQFQISSSVSNRAAAEQIISRWCGALRDALDDANGK
ncbi:MAG TPA: DUF3313 family protein [Steroidobacteraceae bacterium]|nr:DUF3313 family protein [Steroidobacteraceae bacterium]